MKLFFFVTALLSLPAQAIIGGKMALPGQFPPTVFIVNTMCTAIKIGPRHFLSASHCGEAQAGDALQLQWKMSLNLKARPGEAQTATLTLKQAHVIPPPGMQTLVVFEVGEDTPSIPSVPIRATPLAAGDAVFINGYGCTDSRGPKHPYDPRYFPFRQKYAAKRVASLDSVFVNLPAWDADDGTKLSFICYGDSGGPLYTFDPRQGLQLVGVAQATSGDYDRKTILHFDRLDDGTFRFPPQPSVAEWLRSLLKK